MAYGNIIETNKPKRIEAKIRPFLHRCGADLKPYGGSPVIVDCALHAIMEGE